MTRIPKQLANDVQIITQKDSTGNIQTNKHPAKGNVYFGGGNYDMAHRYEKCWINQKQVLMNETKGTMCCMVHQNIIVTLFTTATC